MEALLALASAACLGAGDFCGGWAARRAPVIQVAAISQAVGLALMLLAAPLASSSGASARDLWWGAAAGLFGGLGVAMLYRALAIGAASAVAPTSALCSLACPVLSALAVGERPSPLALAGIGVGAVAIALVSREKPALVVAGSPRGPRGIGLALASGVAIGLFLISLGRTAPAAGLWPLVAARCVSLPLFLAGAWWRCRSLAPPRAALPVTIAAGVLDQSGNALFILAAQRAPLALVAPLNALYPASTVILARLVLGERLQRVQHVGLALALIAILMITH